MASPSSDDPVFALIDRHRAAVDLTVTGREGARAVVAVQPSVRPRADADIVDQGSDRRSAC
jgi:hypothetical protein